MVDAGDVARRHPKVLLLIENLDSCPEGAHEHSRKPAWWNMTVIERGGPVSCGIFARSLTVTPTTWEDYGVTIEQASPG